MKNLKHLMWAAALTGLTLGCGGDEKQPQMTFVYDFDETQQRLNNIGQPASIPDGNAAQTPAFRKMSVHYIELLPTALTPMGQGVIVYQGPETELGGDKAIDFDANIVGAEGEEFLSVDLSKVPPGTYQYIRASVAFQQYDISFNLRNVPFYGDMLNQNGTICSFLGYNTYIRRVTPLQKFIDVNDDKKQGFWVFETMLSDEISQYNNIHSGEGNAGATTVVNPLGSSNPVPAGSCVITGQFASPLVVSDAHDKDVQVKLSFSANKSFEWKDFDGNGTFDFYLDNPNANDRPVDMGLRGLIPSWQEQ